MKNVNWQESQKIELINIVETYKNTNYSYFNPDSWGKESKCFYENKLINCKIFEIKKGN